MGDEAFSLNILDLDYCRRGMEEEGGWIIKEVTRLL